MMLQKTTMTTMYTQSMQIVLETQLRDREHPDRGLEGGHDNPNEQPTHTIT
jgi:hypothetical protein